jgi:hypothetical protein
LRFISLDLHRNGPLVGYDKQQGLIVKNGRGFKCVNNTPLINPDVKSFLFTSNFLLFVKAILLKSFLWNYSFYIRELQSSFASGPSMLIFL